MKLLSCLILLVLCLLISFPATADAFSRRSHSSEMGPHTTPLNTSQTLTHDVSPQAVPEPPAALLMSIGVGLLGLAAMFKRFRRADRE